MTKEQREELKKRFDEKVNEVRREIPNSGKDSAIHEFGYKTRRGNEMFIVTDFGNIFKFIESEVEKAKKETINNLMEDFNFIKEDDLVNRGFITGILNEHLRRIG